MTLYTVWIEVHMAADTCTIRYPLMLHVPSFSCLKQKTMIYCAGLRSTATKKQHACWTQFLAAGSCYLHLHPFAMSLADHVELLNRLDPDHVVLCL